MTRYCQNCGRLATYRSAAPRSYGRRRGHDAHDLCDGCWRRATERLRVDKPHADRIAREIDQTWAEHGGN